MHKMMSSFHFNVFSDLRWTVLSILLVFFMSSALPVQGKELKVGLGDLDYPPFYFVKDGTLHGAAIEIARQVSKNLGHTLSFKRYPFARLQVMLKRGKIELMILYFKTPGRQKDAVYTDLPHIYESSHLLTIKGARISFTGALGDLSSYRFGNVRGYSHGKDYDGAEFLNKQSVRNEQTLLKMLIGGRFDVAVGNKPAILMYARQQGLVDKIAFLTPVIDEGPNYFAFSKAQEDAEELAKQYSVAVREFIATGEYRQILKKYDFDVRDD